MTPTSGAAPYVINASFADRSGLDDGSYRLEVRIPKTVGSCPVPSTGSNQQAIADDLLSAGTFNLTTDVATGECQTIGLRIVNVASSVVVSSADESISNL